jgi:hypothetical protein
VKRRGLKRQREPDELTVSYGYDPDMDHLALSPDQIIAEFQRRRRLTFKIRNWTAGLSRTRPRVRTAASF